jgi:hypothetical protein
MYTAEIQDVEEILSNIETCLTSFQLSLEKDQGRVFVQNRGPKKTKTLVHWEKYGVYYNRHNNQMAMTSDTKVYIGIPYNKTGRSHTTTHQPPPSHPPVA